MQAVEGRGYGTSTYHPIPFIIVFFFVPGVVSDALVTLAKVEFLFSLTDLLFPAKVKLIRLLKGDSE